MKVQLFRRMYLPLWSCVIEKKISNSCLHKFKIRYHRCIKLLFGFSRMHSVTAILFDLGLPSFNMFVWLLGLVVTRWS